MTAEILIEAALAWFMQRGSSRKKRVLTVPITIVHHKKDGSWAFFSGNHLTKVKVTSLEEAIENDATISVLKELPAGFSAIRKNADSPWVRSRPSLK